MAVTRSPLDDSDSYWQSCLSKRITYSQSAEMRRSTARELQARSQWNRGACRAWARSTHKARPPKTRPYMFKKTHQKDTVTLQLYCSGLMLVCGPILQSEPSKINKKVIEGPMRPGFFSLTTWSGLVSTVFIRGPSGIRRCYWWKHTERQTPRMASRRCRGRHRDVPVGIPVAFSFSQWCGI